MELKKLAPWNWFKKEDEFDHAIPVKRHGRGTLSHDRYYDPTLSIHRDIDRLFDQLFHPRNHPATGMFGTSNTFESILLKPKVDLSATDRDYLLTVEIPGVSEKDVTVDINGNTLTVKGEKKQEKEEKEKDYYRIERNYGAFQRVLTLPEDVNLEGIKASFKNGVLSIIMPRKEIAAEKSAKQIEITTES